MEEDDDDLADDDDDEDVLAVAGLVECGARGGDDALAVPGDEAQPLRRLLPRQLSGSKSPTLTVLIKTIVSLFRRRGTSSASASSTTPEWRRNL